MDLQVHSDTDNARIVNNSARGDLLQGAKRNKMHRHFYKLQEGEGKRKKKKSIKNVQILYIKTQCSSKRKIQATYACY